MKHFGALVVMAAILIPITLIIFSALRNWLQPSSDGVEFLLVISSFLLSFVGIILAIVLVSIPTSLLVGYVQRQRKLRK